MLSGREFTAVQRLGVGKEAGETGIHTLNYPKISFFCHCFVYPFLMFSWALFWTTCHHFRQVYWSENGLLNSPLGCSQLHFTRGAERIK
jgi:hypothetical protein